MSFGPYVCGDVKYVNLEFNTPSVAHKFTFANGNDKLNTRDWVNYQLVWSSSDFKVLLNNEVVHEE